MKTKLFAGLGLLGLGVVLLSFSEADETKFKRYEVIRSVNGKVKVYDTLINVNSDFTPENYLAELGFAGDSNIKIINLPHHGEDMIAMHDHHGHFSHGDSTAQIHIVAQTEDFEGTADPGQMMIKKNITIKTIDSMNNETVDVQELIEFVNVDSLMQLHMMHAGDSSMVFVHEIVINEGDDKSQDFKFKQEGEASFERHIVEGNNQMNMMVFGEGKDFTLVIVTDESETGTKSKMVIETNDDAPESIFKVFPNPASKEVSLQLNFEEKANTIITVIDSNGKIVLQLNLGEFTGNYNHNIDVSKWSKGIYFVNVERPNMKLVEKLVIE